MNPSIISIHYCPVKSLSFSSIKKTFVKKNLGIVNDRIFSFSRNINLKTAKLIQNLPKDRKLNHFLTLKNSPVLNKYKFTYNNDLLSMYKDEKIIISISEYENFNDDLISRKLLELEKSLIEPIFLLKNKKYPLFDTTHSSKISNTISLINLNSIKDLEKKINKVIEPSRFRGNLYISDIDAWEERNWINSIIRINKIHFKVVKHIARCSATNLQPNSDNITINLPRAIKKHYNHIDMGVYLSPLDDGEINICDNIYLNE